MAVSEKCTCIKCKRTLADTKFYTYKDAIDFVNKFKIKHYKIKSIQCIIELIK